MSSVTQEELYKKVDQDYQAALGRIIVARVVTGYRDDNCIDVSCDPLARLRIAETPVGDIHRWGGDGWLDPYWNVEVVDEHPSLKGMGGFWVYGPSYNLNGNTEGCKDWDFEGEEKKP